MKIPHPDNRSFLIIFCSIIAILTIGASIFLYMNPPEDPKIVAEREAAEARQHSDKWNVYSDGLGVNFAHPSNWFVGSSYGIIVLSGFGPDEKDTLNVIGISGPEARNADAKFGSVTYYYDQKSALWMMKTNRLADSPDGKMITKRATPLFYTASGHPVFAGTERWKTNIVALSATEFVVVNISGSGFTKILDPFTKTIHASDKKLSNEEIDELIKEIQESEK